jgi:hypothetical protein
VGSWTKGLVVGLALTAAAAAVVVSGVVSFRWPWERLGDFNRVEVAFDLPETARIASVEPITLDCRARVHAVVPVEGVREHRFLGRVYRTDRVRMAAIGDVDTCVEGASLRVAHHDDGTTELVLPADTIRFVRPRVDALATADSVTVEKGTVGKLTDAFPWVDESSPLVPQSYAYAQQVIGGSACMQAAYAATSQLLVDGYRGQFAGQGIDPDRLRVRIEGRPDFGQNETGVAAPSEIEFLVQEGEVTCRPADDADVPEPPNR